MLRVCTKNDGAEQALAAMETITGERTEGCPWRAFEDPFVGEVLRAYRHWKERQLHLVWGHDPPYALMRGLEVYDAALKAVQSHDAQQERDARKREHEKRLGEQKTKRRR